MNKHYYYFAYGSNMNPERMYARVPNARIVGRGSIRGWRLVERLYADLQHCPHESVEGVVWEIDIVGIANLDRAEGFPWTYTSRSVGVRLASGRIVSAMVYVMTKDAAIKRSGYAYPDDYRRICSTGARLFGVKDSFNK